MKDGRQELLLWMDFGFLSWNCVDMHSQIASEFFEFGGIKMSQLVSSRDVVYMTLVTRLSSVHDSEISNIF